MAAADEDEPAVASTDAFAQPWQIGRDVRRGELDVSRWGAYELVGARDERAEVETVGFDAERVEGDAVGHRAELVAPRTHADREVEQPHRAGVGQRVGGHIGVRAERGGDAAEVLLVERTDVDLVVGHARGERTQADEDLPLFGTVDEREERVGPFPCAANRPAPDELAEERLLERRCAGQDHVRMPAGLVEPVVDADHAVERGERLVDARRFGRAQHRVPRDDHHRAQLAIAGGRDVLCQT